MAEKRSLDFLEVDARSCYGLAWRIDVTEIRCLDSVEVDVRRLAWSVDVTEIRCMNSVEVDATKLAWRVDEAGAGLDSEPWSLDSEAWIQWMWMRGSRRLM